MQKSADFQVESVDFIRLGTRLSHNEAGSFEPKIGPNKNWSIQARGEMGQGGQEGTGQ